MVGNARKSDGAEIDRIEFAQLLEAVLRHHPAGVGVALTAPIEGRPGDFEIVGYSRGFKHTNPLWNDLTADPIARNYGNLISHANKPFWLPERLETLSTEKAPDLIIEIQKAKVETQRFGAFLE